MSSPLRCLAVLVALAGATACAGPDTVVLVVMDGTLAKPAHHFDVQATVGSDAHTLQVPDAPGDPIFLPASFTLQIPRSRVGTLTVNVVARDATGAEIAHASGMLLEIAPGVQDELHVDFGAP
jgi:hypothetical protein